MILKSVVLAVLAVIGYYVVNFIWSMDFHVHYKKHHPGQCRQVKGHTFGSEDLQVTSDGLAFITSGFYFETSSQGFKDFVNANDVKGKLFLYDFKEPDLGAIELTIRPSASFRLDAFGPHGISVLEDKVKGEHILYVISHLPNKPDRVEKFKYSPDSRELVHLKYFTGDLLRITNDLAVLEEDKFYITNSLYYKTQTLNMVENLLNLPFGSVLFYNGTGFETVVNQQFGPNGVLLSKTKRFLYVNFPLLRQVQVWERKGDNSLTWLQSLNLRSAVDNPNLSQSGNGLYIGSHPILYKVFAHLHDPREKSPSSVLYLPLKADGKMAKEEDVIELFYDHGDLIKASSVAAVYNNKLLIGSVMDKLVLCDLNGIILPEGA